MSFSVAQNESNYEPEQEEQNQPEMASAPGLQDGSYPFEAMRLKVGDRLQMQLPPRFASDRLIVRLIGYISNLSLLTTPPRGANGLRMTIEEGDELFVRVFTSQNAFGFAANVEKIIRLPFEYLHLSFPTEVKGMTIRKAPRVKTKIICSLIKAQSGGEKETGVLTNLSANGALLATRGVLLDKGDTIKLSFRLLLHANEVFLNLNAVVRSQIIDETATNKKAAFFGLEFAELNSNDCMVLQSMVYQQMIEQPQTVM